MLGTELLQSQADLVRTDFKGVSKRILKESRNGKVGMEFALKENPAALSSVL